MTKSLNSLWKLSIALIISGAINLVLLAIIFYGYIREQPPIPYCELKPIQSEQSPLVIDQSNHEVIRYFRKMPLEWLITRLNNTQPVENGYTQRDLSLATLVTFHHFDLDRALIGLPRIEQKRTIIYGKFRDGHPAELTVYPGLTDRQFTAIQSFAKLEQWPKTAEGLFLMLQKQETDDKEMSLMNTFSMTPEFLSVEMLFNRGGITIEKEVLVRMLIEGSWNTLSDFLKQQKTAQDLSATRRQQFLLEYIQQNSKTAAEIILRTDIIFALTKLDDPSILMLLNLLNEKAPDSERFAAALLKSPRTDAVWKKAAERLYQYADEKVPDTSNQKSTLSRFIPDYQIKGTQATVSSVPPIPPPKTLPTGQNSPKTPSPLSPAKKLIQKQPLKEDFLYVIQEGDTLWKLSRRFQINVNELKSYNQLTSNALHPGKTLKIPSKK